MATKRKTKKAKKPKGQRRTIQKSSANGKLKDHILALVQKGPKQGCRSDNLVRALAKRGFKVLVQNVGRSVFSEPRLVSDGKFIRLATREEIAGRTDKIELALENQKAGLRKRKNDDADGVRGPNKSKANIGAAVQVLDTVIDSAKELPDKTRTQLLATVRRLLTGEAF